jgi:hypothetical protein
MAEGFENAADDAREVAKIKIETEKKLSEIFNARHKADMDYNNKLVKQRRMEQILTRAGSAAGGGIGGAAFSMIQNIGQAKYSGYKRLEELKNLESGQILSPEQAKERDMLSSGSGASNKVFGKLEKTFDKHFGGDSKWNKFFGGQGKMAAAGLGMGAVGGGMALGKMIIDSSPMFQQMLKILNFGVMMILRPIGDFFGFLMRPIMLMLLRKFIIPFYQTALPVMQEMGTVIGEVIAPVLERILLGVIGVVQLLAAASPIAMLLGNSQGLVQEGMKNLEAALTGVISTDITNPEIRDAGAKIESKLGEVGESLGSKYQATIAALDRARNAPTTEASKKANEDLSKKINKWTEFMGSKGMLQQDGLMKVGRYTTEAMAGVKEGKFTSVDEAMNWFAQQMFKGGINKYAHGGIINEPVIGIGRSGAGYLIAESGAERVTPVSGGGGHVTINVYGDVDNKTMDTFERKVLDVLGKSNARRGL